MALALEPSWWPVQGGSNKTQPSGPLLRSQLKRSPFMQTPSRRLCAFALILGVSVAPASAESFRLDKKFDLAAGDRFVLVSEVGRVELRGIAGRQATIVVTSDRTDLAARYDFRFDQASRPAEDGGGAQGQGPAELGSEGRAGRRAHRDRGAARYAPSSSTARVGASTSPPSTRRSRRAARAGESRSPTFTATWPSSSSGGGRRTALGARGGASGELRRERARGEHRRWRVRG